MTTVRYRRLQPVRPVRRHPRLGLLFSERKSLPQRRPMPILKRGYVVPLLISALAFSGCNSPSAPSTPNVTGTWVGTISFNTASSGGVSAPFVMTLNQGGGDSIGGTFSASGLFSGTVTGFAYNPGACSAGLNCLELTFNFLGAATNGSACTGSFVLLTGASATHMTIDAGPPYTGNAEGNCTNLPLGVEIQVTLG
jgi:hypothetical protein